MPEYLAGDAAQVRLEGGQEVLHPGQDPVAAGDLTVQPGDARCLPDVVLDRGLSTEAKVNTCVSYSLFVVLE